MPSSKKESAFPNQLAINTHLVTYHKMFWFSSCFDAYDILIHKKQGEKTDASTVSMLLWHKRTFWLDNTYLHLFWDLSLLELSFVLVLISQPWLSYT